MEQLAFFPACGHSKGLPTDILEYLPNIFDQKMGDKLMEGFIG